MKIHALKCWPEYYQAIIDGKKKFEYRINDRDFQVGDMLRLKEWSPATDRYTGRKCVVSVDYILPMIDHPTAPTAYIIMSISLKAKNTPKAICLECGKGEKKVRFYSCIDCAAIVCDDCLQNKTFCPNCGSSEFSVPKEKIEEEPVMCSRSTVACVLCVHNSKCVMPKIASEKYDVRMLEARVGKLEHRQGNIDLPSTGGLQQWSLQPVDFHRKAVEELVDAECRIKEIVEERDQAKQNCEKLALALLDAQGKLTHIEIEAAALGNRKIIELCDFAKAHISKVLEGK